MESEGRAGLDVNVFDHVENGVAGGSTSHVELRVRGSALGLREVVFGRSLAVNVNGDFQAIKSWNDGHGEFAVASRRNWPRGRKA